MEAFNRSMPSQQQAGLATLSVAAATVLKPENKIVFIDTNGAYVLNLPPVGQMRGQMVCITHRGVTGSASSITVSDYNKGGSSSIHESANWTNQIINAQYEEVVAFSDGYMWHILKGQTS